MFHITNDSLNDVSGGGGSSEVRSHDAVHVDGLVHRRADQLCVEVVSEVLQHVYRRVYHGYWVSDVLAGDCSTWMRENCFVLGWQFAETTF